MWLSPSFAEADASARACAERRCEAVIEMLEEALRRRPGDFGLHYQLGLCYSGACHHPLTCPDMAVPYLRRALALLEPSAPDRAQVLDALGNVLAASRDSPRGTALGDAIACHREAARIYQSRGDADDWARVEFNLGNACCELAETGDSSRWQEAVGHYRNALSRRTRERGAEQYAKVLENLGTAYHALADLRRCLLCYRRALAVYSPAAHPAENAALQNNIGNAILSAPPSEPGRDARHAGQALRHFDRALRTQSGDPYSRAYAITQFNRAHALLRFSPVQAAECLRQACAAFEHCGDSEHARLARARLDRLEPPPVRR